MSKKSKVLFLLSKGNAIRNGDSDGVLTVFRAYKNVAKPTELIFIWLGEAKFITRILSLVFCRWVFYIPALLTFMFVRYKVRKKYFVVDTLFQFAYQYYAICLIFFRYGHIKTIIFHGGSQMLNFLTFFGMERSYDLMFYYHGGDLSKLNRYGIGLQELGKLKAIFYVNGRAHIQGKTMLNSLKHYLIYNGVDNSNLQKTAIKRAKGVRFIVGGRMWKPKGYDLVIKAFLKAADINNKSLTVFGLDDSEYSRELKTLALDADNVIFIDKLPNKELRALIARCDYGIVSTIPSLYQEGLPMVLLEYLSEGLNVAVTGSGDSIGFCNQTNIDYVEITGDTEEKILESFTKFFDCFNSIKTEEISNDVLNKRLYKISSKRMLDDFVRVIKEKN